MLLLISLHIKPTNSFLKTFYASDPLLHTCRDTGSLNSAHIVDMLPFLTHIVDMLPSAPHSKRSGITFSLILWKSLQGTPILYNSAMVRAAAFTFIPN